ncbi:endonuclease domain-containing protein [Streptomyces sp. URMC 126]|uniref:endonuclease domain-containing protein n=1 Tax=Streptomyces sp. URMC 126 TaxID=3423401 RepID=UPI003F1BBA92
MLREGRAPRRLSVRPRRGLSPGRAARAPEGRERACSTRLAAPAEHVDHDHATGAVRGVLDSSRDAALGQFKDRPDVTRRAAEYVEGNVWKPTLVAPGVCRRPS